VRILESSWQLSGHRALWLLTCRSSPHGHAGAGSPAVILEALGKQILGIVVVGVCWLGVAVSGQAGFSVGCLVARCLDSLNRFLARGLEASGGIGT
jgi:hypothetical protein